MSYPFRRAAAGLLAGLALWLFGASQALAARPDTTGWSQLESPGGHFLVHYEPGNATAAEAAAANFDAAYATEIGGWGMPAPLDDGDGLIDVYLTDTGGNLGEAYHDDYTTPTTSGYLLLNPSSASDPSIAAHELFHLIQYAIYAHGAKFLVEGTAEWAAANVTQGTGWLLTYLANPEQPLDCLPGSPCAPAPDQDHSYSRWLFFEHLSERYGPGIVGEIIQRAGQLDAQTDASLDLRAIDDVLAAHASSLAQQFDSFASDNADAGYSFPGLAGHSPTPAAAFYTGVTALALPTQTFTVDHLAASYVKLLSGDSRFSNAGCGDATLHVRVTLPADAASAPALAASDGIHPLTAGGGDAAIDLPWTTCTGASALLSLPNASRTLDGAEFAVSVSVTPAQPKQRPGTAAPRIRLSLPRLAHRVVRFKVRSSARGTLAVLFKTGYVRGSYSLRRGTNRLRLRLPRGVRPGRHLVVFTVYSTTGTRGKTIKRRVKAGF